MDKLILLSLVFATILIPALSARVPSPRKGLALTLVGMAGYLILYTVTVLFIAVRFINTTK
jgi:hypothetical protein